MRKIASVAGCAALVLWLAAGSLSAQTVVPNGDFELQDQGPWVQTGDNAGVKCEKYDTDGDGTKSWCWKRKPGYSPFGGGNGGLSMDVHLLAGVTYGFNARIAYLCTC